MSNSISDPTLLGWTVREPDKALIVQSQYTVTIDDAVSTAVRTQTFLPGATLDGQVPQSVIDVIGHVWTPDVIAAQQNAAAAAEAARIAAFNAAINNLQQAKSVAAANGQDAVVTSLTAEIARLTAARDAGLPFNDS